MRTLILKTSISLFILLSISIISFSQVDSSLSTLRTEIFESKCIGTSQTNSGDLDWTFTLLHKPIKHPTTEQDQNLIDSMKASKQLLRQQLLHLDEFEENKTRAITPIRGTNFQGNSNNGSTPLDNSIAVSNGGYLVSVANSTINMYNTSGTSLYFNSLSSFVNIPGVSSVYDPQVLYDRTKDRFIMVALSGTSSSTSRLIVCFSKTNNPTGSWWVYSLSGNPLSNSKWLDYPRIAITNGELFVTGNLFSNSNVFNQGVIYQINKLQGFSGLTLSSSVWYNIPGSPASLLPVGHGHGSTSYGPACYFVSTSSSGASWVKLYRINNLLSSSPNLYYNLINCSAYSVAGDASQSGTSNLLDVGDCRSLSGFFLNNIIHFVHNIDKGSGYCGIQYHRLNVTSLTDASSTWSGTATSDYAYGAITSFTNSSTDKSIMMGVQSVTASTFPSIRAVNCDNNFTWSPSITIKSGAGYVNVLTSSTERWGDYSGISRKHNSSSPSVWVSGAYGTTAKNWSTWISEIRAGSNRLINEEDESNNQNVKVFPQPVMNIFNLEFFMAQKDFVTISLFDNGGKMVKEFFKGEVELGKNVLTFNKANLPIGIYYLIGIDKSSNNLIQEKLIIAN